MVTFKRLSPLAQWASVWRISISCFDLFIVMQSNKALGAHKKSRGAEFARSLRKNALVKPRMVAS